MTRPNFVPKKIISIKLLNKIISVKVQDKSQVNVHINRCVKQLGMSKYHEHVLNQTNNVGKSKDACTKGHMHKCY